MFVCVLVDILDVFGVEVAEEDEEDIETVGDLVSYVQRGVGTEVRPCTLPAPEEWYHTAPEYADVREALIEDAGVETEAVAPFRMLSEIFRSRGRSRAWRKVRARLEAEGYFCPKLEHNGLREAALLACLIPSIFLLTRSGWWGGPALLLSFCAYFALPRVLPRALGGRFPSGWRTVADVANDIVWHGDPQVWLRRQGVAHPWTAADVQMITIRIVSQFSGAPPESISLETRFTEYFRGK